MKVLLFAIVLLSLGSCDIEFEKLKNKELNDLLLDYSQNGSQTVLAALLSKGADIKASDEQGRTVLHLAVLKHPQANSIVSYFISSGAQIDAQDLEGNTPLHLAAANSEIRVIRILYTNGADLCIQNNKKQVPFDVVGENPHQPSADFLKSYCKKE